MPLITPRLRSGAPSSRFLNNKKLKIGISAVVVAAFAVTGLAATPAFAGPETTPGIFADDLRPTTSADRDTNSVELGVRFSPRSDGAVTALQYYQGVAARGVTTATLWSSGGRVLSRVTFPESRTEGWRTVPLAAPVQLTADSAYVVSYHAPTGRYPSISRDLSSARTQNGFSLSAGAGVYRYGDADEVPRSTYEGSNYLVDVVYDADGSVTTPAPAPTEPATPVPTADPAPAPSPAPPTSTGGRVVLGRTFPTAATTGVPAGTSLTPYTGPCTIQTANAVIDAKVINCDLRILAPNVTINRSQINGTVFTNSNDSTSSFTISDSDVRVGEQAGTGIGDVNFTAVRVHVTGGNRSINCFRNCTVESSYVHGQFRDATGQYHESGIRMGSNGVIRGNTIACTAPNVAPSAGCSAALTGYGDFATVENNTIDGNLFIAGSGGYCTYGGSSTGKPYSAGVNDIKFTNNVWERGESGQCGYWGAIVSFDGNAPGNVWTNNVYDDGKPVG
jgi:hypothetical protein